MAFGEDAIGNTYVVDLGGSIFRILTDTLVVGDFDANGIVNSADFETCETNLLITSGASFADGDVDGSDFLVRQQKHGAAAQDFPPSPGAAAALVPEPSCLGLLLLGMLSVSVRARTKLFG